MAIRIHVVKAKSHAETLPHYPSTLSSVFGPSYVRTEEPSFSEEERIYANTNLSARFPGKVKPSEQHELGLIESDMEKGKLSVSLSNTPSLNTAERKKSLAEP